MNNSKNIVEYGSSSESEEGEGRRCGICGYRPASNWTRHFTRHHKDRQPIELEEGAEPTDPDSNPDAIRKIRRLAETNPEYFLLPTAEEEKDAPRGESAISSLSFDRNAMTVNESRVSAFSPMNAAEESSEELGKRQGGPPSRKFAVSERQMRTKHLMEVIENSDFDNLESLDTFVDCSDLLADYDLVRDLMLKQEASVEGLLANMEVMTGWDEGQVLGLLFVSLMWGKNGIERAKEIAVAYTVVLRRSASKKLISLLKRAGFSTIMSEWLVDSLPRLNRSHGHLLDYFKGQPGDADPHVFELGYLCRAEEGMEQFKRLARRTIGGAHVGTIAQCSRALPGQPQMGLMQFRAFMRTLWLPSNEQSFVAARAELARTPFRKWEQVIVASEQSLVESLADGRTAEEHVKRLEGEYVGLKVGFLNANLREGKSIVESTLQYFESRPNPTQLAVAIYAVGLSEKRYKQLWQLPAGTGKSRVIATAALVWAKANVGGKIHIVIPNELLHARDEATFKNLWRLGHIEDRVRYVSSLPKGVADGDLVLLDEADHLIFSQTDAVRELLAAHKVLAFTATITKSDFESVEIDVVKMMGYTPYKYKVVDRGIEIEPDYNERFEGEGEPSLVDLVLARRQKNPVLVFCTPESLVGLTEQLPSLIQLEKVTDYKVLQSCEDKEDDGEYKVFAAAEESSMRGLDFRAPRLGMVLIVNAPFSSPRDRSQGLSRVGRFSDKCQRIKLGTFADVDNDKSTAVWRRLLKLKEEGMRKKDKYKMKVGPGGDNKKGLV